MTLFERISEVIVAEKQAILRCWREDVRASPPPVLERLQLSDEDLENHLPALLDDLANTMCGRPTPQVEDAGTQHGHQRRQLGYRVDECLYEMHLFRRVLLDSIEAHDDAIAGATQHELASVRGALLELLDRSIQASVQQFIREAEAERDRAHQRLEEVNRELQASHEQKDRFLAMLAHELRNPLAPIMTSVAVLKVPDLSPERRRRASEIIERQTQYQTRLIDDLLDINRIAHGKIELKRAMVDLRDGVRHAVETCTPGIDAKSQQLRTELPADPVQAFADPTRVAQVITNLLGNASKFTPEQGAITVALRAEGGDAVLRVRDRGAGIAASLLPRIFDLFMQADSSLHHHDGGLGVGLWLAQKLVEMHGGTLEASSEGPGCGALFVARLPLAAGQPLRAAAPAQAARRAPGARLIAVVEDNDDARTSLVDMLSIWGFDVREASDGEAALRLAAEHDPEVYLLDLGLPRIDGYELARRLRAAERDREPVLIALSGYASADDRRRSADAGFDHHLAKPVDVELLRAILDARASAQW